VLALPRGAHGSIVGERSIEKKVVFCIELCVRPKTKSTRQNPTPRALGLRANDRRCGGVTRARVTLGFPWIDCGRKKH
jgi:hypothetical protein